MKYINCKKENFCQVIGKKKIIYFGASSVLQKYYVKYVDWFEELSNQVLFFVDNDEKKWYTKFQLGGKKYNIYPAAKLDDVKEKDVVLVIATSKKFILPICDCLDKIGNLRACLCFSLILLLQSENISDSAVMPMLFANIPAVISKVIHTFWFSKDKIPQNYQKCLDSWKKYCPDYEIKIWDSNNYDVTKNEYAYEAYKRKNWAFVSDYARLDVIYHHGGIYMDMDVEVLKSLDDLLKFQCFFGIDKVKCIDLGTGFGAIKGNQFIKKLLDKYVDFKFYQEDGSLNRTPQPQLLLDIFLKYGYLKKRDSQFVNGMAFLSTNLLNIYSGKEFWNPYHCSGKEYLVHWHNAGWWSEEEREERYKNVYEVTEQIEKKFEFYN